MGPVQRQKWAVRHQSRVDVLPSYNGGGTWRFWQQVQREGNNDRRREQAKVTDAKSDGDRC